MNVSKKSKHGRIRWASQLDSWTVRVTSGGGPASWTVRVTSGGSTHLKITSKQYLIKHYLLNSWPDEYLSILNMNFIL